MTLQLDASSTNNSHLSQETISVFVQETRQIHSLIVSHCNSSCCWM